MNQNESGRYLRGEGGGQNNDAGKGLGGPCPTDVALVTVPGVSFVRCRYATARTMPRRSSRPFWPGGVMHPPPRWAMRGANMHPALVIGVRPLHTLVNVSAHSTFVAALQDLFHSHPILEAKPDGH